MKRRLLGKQKVHVVTIHVNIYSNCERGNAKIQFYCNVTVSFQDKGIVTQNTDEVIQWKS